MLINIGDEKGELLDRAIERSSPRLLLELGTYCGYSGLRMARVMPAGARVISIEYLEANADIARRIWAHAGVEDRLTVVVGTLGLVAFLVGGVLIATASPVPSATRADRVAGQSVTPGPTGPAAPGFVGPKSGPISEDLELSSVGDVDSRLVRCHGMDNPACIFLARVAVTVVTGSLDSGAGAVTRVDVSRSLLCNSDTDCWGIRSAPLRNSVTARIRAYCPGRKRLPGLGNSQRT